MFFDLFQVLSGALTKCERRRKTSIEILKESGPQAVSYVPRCELDGSFSQVQCWGDGDDVQCWCVNDEGHLIDGTRSKETPDCKPSKGLMLFNPLSLLAMTGT